MKKNFNALFITHEGFGSSIFRSQVIEHCESMRELGYDFDILTYETFKKAWHISLENAKDYRSKTKKEIYLKKAANIYYPGSTFVNLLLLARDLINIKKVNSYKLIHARADYTAFLCILLKPLHKVPVVWDCRGDSVDELQFASEKLSKIFRLFINYFLIPRQRLIKKIASLYCSGCICVSESLYEFVRPINKSYPIEIIPCPVPVNRFYFSNELRLTTRMQLGIAENEDLFIYSGSMTGYQSISNFLWYYTKILELNNSKIIVATIDVEVARQLFQGYDKDRLFISKFTYEEMNNLYCAADFALMTRLHRNLNNVASPTKFGEYCLTGLKVIHNNSIDQVTEFASRIGNGCDLDSWPISKLTTDQRYGIANVAKNIYGRNFLNQSYTTLYDKLCESHSIVEN